MSSEPIEISWTAIQSINDSMHHAADKSQWLDVLELATKRHTMLQEHFGKYPVGPSNADFYRLHMDNLLRGEADLQIAVRNARKSLMSESLDIRHKQHALGAYLNVAMR